MTALHLTPAKQKPHILSLFPHLKNLPGTWGGKGFRASVHPHHGRAYLLHEHVDVGLRGVQHVAVGMLQPPDRDVHGFAVYVYPPPRPWGQEQPETGRKMSAKVARPSQ